VCQHCLVFQLLVAHPSLLSKNRVALGSSTPRSAAPSGSAAPFCWHVHDGFAHCRETCRPDPSAAEIRPASATSTSIRLINKLSRSVNIGRALFVPSVCIAEKQRRLRPRPGMRFNVQIRPSSAPVGLHRTRHFWREPGMSLKRVRRHLWGAASGMCVAGLVSGSLGFVVVLGVRLPVATIVRWDLFKFLESYRFVTFQRAVTTLR